MPVVVPHLTTPEGNAARERAVEEARLRGATLHVVAFVANPERSQAAERYTGDRARAVEELERQVASLRESGLEVEGHAPTGVGHLSEAVMGVADEVKADLIVIGIRRRSRVGKLVMGSDAQEILLGADCEVLAVKAPVETA